MMCCCRQCCLVGSLASRVCCRLQDGKNSGRGALVKVGTWKVLCQFFCPINGCVSSLMVILLSVLLACVLQPGCSMAYGSLACCAAIVWCVS